MGCFQSPISCSSHKLGGYYTICLSLLLVLVLSSGNSQRLMVEGRAMKKTVSMSNEVEENKSINKAMILRGKIGSRPPSCVGRCGTCKPCEAVQVATEPPIKPANTNSSPPASHHVAYFGGQFSSEYKPISWKCKCGGVIYNP